MYTIFEIYKIDEFSEDVEVVEYGTWDPYHGVIIFEKDIEKIEKKLIHPNFTKFGINIPHI